MSTTTGFEEGAIGAHPRSHQAGARLPIGTCLIEDLYEINRAGSDYESKKVGDGEALNEGCECLLA